MLYFSLLLLFCYFLRRFVGWSLFFGFDFMSLDSSLSNQESILTCLLSSWLIIKLYHFYYGSRTLYYIILLNCILLDCFILCYDYYLVLLLLFSFYFHFYFSISFYFTLQILFDLVLHLLFYLVFVSSYLLSFYIIIYPA